MFSNEQERDILENILHFSFETLGCQRRVLIETLDLTH